MTTAEVVCHSVAPNGEELITVEVEFHRFILAEINTHRVLSRNYQSSRAVPVEKMIKQVRENPALPAHWGKNQRGMVADEELNADVKYIEATGKRKSVTITEAWSTAASAAAFWAENLNNAGYHKQIVNRVLEPYIWTKGVITATKSGWDSVFKLRCHKDAQPEFQVLANKIREAIEGSKPKYLNYGQWHLPYVPNYDEDGNPSYYDDPTEAIKISCSCCAQVSYRVLDDSLDKAIKIYDMLNLPHNGLFKEDPPHFSPAEHVAMCLPYKEGNPDGYTPSEVGGNFQTTAFYQYRKMLEQGTELENTIL